MGKSLREVMTAKSEDGLLDYLNNFESYTPDAIEAAVDELKRRGKYFSEDQLREIDQKIQKRANDENEEDPLFEPDSWKKT